MDDPEFHFERARGVVWVCDIVSSTKLLNDDSGAAVFETFIPRFHWISRLAVEASGGEFIKWTGDGFLAWYPVPLHRELGFRAAAVFNAAWHLTFLLNVTKLAVSSDKKFGIRHGVTYEQDALITRIKTGPSESMDLLGRSVVLAFRLAGVTAKFPGIVTQGELVRASRGRNSAAIVYKPWKPTTDDLVRHFKGEKWGTRALYRSDEIQPKHGVSSKTILRNAKVAVAKARVGNRSSEADDPKFSFALEFMNKIMKGPEWSRETGAAYTKFLRENLLEVLETLIPSFEAEIRSREP